jgi:hypothetical protein
LTTSLDILVSFAYYGAAFAKYLPEPAPIFIGPLVLPLDLFLIRFYAGVLDLDPAVPIPLMPGFYEICFLALNPPGCITLGLLF